MPRKLLTDRLVKGARSDVRIAFFDTHTRGLALRVTPTGAKTWYFVCRVNGSPSQWDRLATVDAMSLADARKVARKRRAIVDDGRNPAAERRAERVAARTPAPGGFTFGDLCDLYVKIAAGQKKTWRDDVAKIDKYLLPAWGGLPLRDVTRAQVHELLDTLVADGMTVGVNRVQALISRLFTVAVDRSLLESHPAARMEKRFKEMPSERVLTDDELRALWAGLDAHPGRAADALRLRLLTGQRGEEVVGMLWSEVDLAARVWQLSPERTKNGRAHAVPLSAPAMALIKRAKSAGEGDATRVFPFLTLRSDDHRALAVIHGGAYEWKDVRRTVATRLAGLGFDETCIGRVLNHARVTVTGRHYNQHAYLDEKRAALDDWARALADIVSARKPRGAAVVRFRRQSR